VRITRRQALAGGTAAAASAAVPAVARAQDKKAMNRTALTSSLEVVQTAVVAYTAIANGDLLRGSVQTTFRTFLDHEQQHEQALGDALDGIGAKQPAPPTRAQIRGLTSLRSQQQAIAFAIALERREVATFYKATETLKDANALKTLASIMGCDGQHLTVLRQLAGRTAVPRAFETGQA
jgi:rubrerythrin